MLVLFVVNKSFLVGWLRLSTSHHFFVNTCKSYSGVSNCWLQDVSVSLSIAGQFSVNWFYLKLKLVGW